MNRKKQILIELAVLTLLAFIFLRFQSFYLSGESLLYANETGLHYGPSKEVLLEHQEGKNVLMAGWVDSRTLSVIQGKKYGPFYMLRGGGITGELSIQREEEAAIALLSKKDCVLLGLVDKERYPECVSVIAQFEIKSNDTEGEDLFLEAQVQENGFFVRTDELGRTLTDEEWYNFLNVEGYNAEGELLFKNN